MDAGRDEPCSHAISDGTIAQRNSYGRTPTHRAAERGPGSAAARGGRLPLAVGW